MNRDEIISRLKLILSETFEVDTAGVTETTHLFNDLDLDSIDAVDLAIRLQELTGKRIRPEEFKNVRTVGDVIHTVETLLAN